MNEPASNPIQPKDDGNVASHTQVNDTISDIMNSDEYKQTLDYVFANDVGNLPDRPTHDHNGINPAAEQHNQTNPLDTFTNESVSTVENDTKRSKPVNIATNEQNIQYKQSLKPTKSDEAGIYESSPDWLLDHEYQITASGSQVDDISHACETMARIKLGQITALVDALPLRDDIDTYALQQELERLIKPCLQTKLSHSPFFTMHQVLRHRRSWDVHPEGGLTVNFDEPLILNPNEPLLKIALLPKDLTQDIFDGKPAHIRSAHVNENGVAYVNECLSADLSVEEGRHVNKAGGSGQYVAGKNYNTNNWRASKIDRQS